MAYTPQNWADGVSGQTPISAARLNYMEQGIAGSYATGNEPGIVEVDSYSGSDDTKLGEAMKYAAAQTYKPTLRLSNRAWTFYTERTLYTGFKITGTGRGYEQPRGNNPYGTLVNISLSNGKAWLHVASATYGCYIGNLAFNGNNATRFMVSDSLSGVLWTTTIENVGFANFLNVLGYPGNPLYVTAVTFQGFWNINNSFNTGVTIGGSDSQLWTSGMLLDTPPNITPGGAGTFNLRCEGLGKTVIGPLYHTAQGVSGVLVTSTWSGQQGQLVFTGNRTEGRHADEWCRGALMIIEGNSGVILRDCWWGFAMGDPNNTGHPTADTGVIMVRSKSGYAPQVVVDGAVYQRGQGANTNGALISEDVPFLSNDGGYVRVSNVLTSGAGQWTKRPGVKNYSGTLIHDDSVRDL